MRYPSAIPAVPSFCSSADQIRVGSTHAAIKCSDTDTDMFLWGSNSYFELGSEIKKSRKYALDNSDQLILLDFSLG